MPLWQGGTLNGRRATSPIMRKTGFDTQYYSWGVLPHNCGGTDLNLIVTCMVLKATANDMDTSSPFG
ncbi:hypothetical protein TNCV_931161 [Trichonephila clavipes]|uniref:Uncharacterized protein n=1 Tax=Trichonephila clavipes TaxID=2585209 RepID=A0A8X6W2C5_TRICX|nr:hypothetical protein TNCV_931161 [Trichonephila clavipes]